MSLIPFVPRVPGVPILAGYAAPPVPLQTSDLVSGTASIFIQQWGIFLNGIPVVNSDSVVTVGFKRDWVVATYPIEEGGFESYDKVQMAFEGRVRFSAGGSLLNRQALLNSVEAIAGTLTKYDLATPERTYQNINVTHYDYHRAANAGVGLMIVDVHCTEVRETASAAFSSTQAPSGASAANGGTVQPTAAPPSVTAAGPDVQGTPKNFPENAPDRPPLI